MFPRRDQGSLHHHFLYKLLFDNFISQDPGKSDFMQYVEQYPKENREGVTDIAKETLEKEANSMKFPITEKITHVQLASAAIVWCPSPLLHHDHVCDHGYVG